MSHGVFYSGQGFECGSGFGTEFLEINSDKLLMAVYGGRHYHVIDILDRKIILARHGPTSQQVIFKVLQKSAGQQEYSEKGCS